MSRGFCPYISTHYENKNNFSKRYMETNLKHEKEFHLMQVLTKFTSTTEKVFLASRLPPLSPNTLADMYYPI